MIHNKVPMTERLPLCPLWNRAEWEARSEQLLAHRSEIALKAKQARQTAPPAV